mgnify:CR=1 FL=1
MAREKHSYVSHFCEEQYLIDDIAFTRIVIKPYQSIEALHEYAAARAAEGKSFDVVEQRTEWTGANGKRKHTELSRTEYRPAPAQ